MCGRFFMIPTDEILDRLASRYSGDRLEQMARGEVFPSLLTPVLAPNRKRQPDWFLMRWGYRMGTGSRLLINARYETAASKPTFVPSLSQRRCAIPLHHYFEWSPEGKRYSLQPPAGEGCCLAGLYRYEADGQPAFTLLTQPAVPALAALHPRMPILLTGEDARRWVQGTLNLTDLASVSVTHLRSHPFH